MEVTNTNFSDMLPQIQNAINKCTFMAIDCEFTGLNITRNINALDTPQEYYQKVRRNCREFLIIQYGLCTFKYDAKNNVFKKDDFNFYIFRRPVNRNIPDQRFLCQASSIHFLVSESFDFNKLFKEGIPYLNEEESEAYKAAVEESYKRRSDLIQSQQDTTNESIPIPDNAKAFIEDVIEQLEEFIKSGNDELQLPRCNAFYRRLIYQTKTEKFADKICLETRQMNKDRILFATKFKSKENEEESERKKYNEQLKELEDFVGFSKLIKMIINARKLVVGHNMCLDLLHTIDKFLMPLPEDYFDFKGMAHDLFPKILDTKYMSSCEPFKDIITSNVLKHLYDTVSQEPFKIPTIETEDGVQGYSLIDMKEHQAGFDAYLTGVCFLAMWKYLGSSKKLDDKRTFSNFNLLEPYMNRIFLMTLLDNQFINLGGKDLNPPRDHVFHLSFPKEWKTNDISQLFSPFGNVHVSWIDETSAYVTLYKRDQAATALNALSNGESYKIMTYAKRKALLRGVSTPPSSTVLLKKQRICEGPPTKRRKLDSTSSNSDVRPKRSIDPIEEEHLESEDSQSSKRSNKAFMEDSSWD
ncbi:unnamed protein product [Callosobruchus maculatus]|uniref:Poly(A)-specific ribonuclease PARN n=2 Tax=Callosobruchus maculatus TaxID=64391 RepID=A0A653C6G0_CALMS|nr:unnamed protein product [Callosobruchus maculatus]